MVSFVVSGTPVATVFEVPKLVRKSLRTMPLCSRAFGPFEPSPGNGPAVSSGTGALQALAGVEASAGMAVTVAAAEFAAEVVEPVDLAACVGVVVALPPPFLADSPQP